MREEIGTREGLDRVCHARVEKQTVDSSVFFGENSSCQNNIIKFDVYERLA